MDKGILGWDKNGVQPDKPQALVLWAKSGEVHRQAGPRSQDASVIPGRLHPQPTLSQDLVRDSPSVPEARCSFRAGSAGVWGGGGGGQQDPLCGLLLCLEGPKNISLHQRQHQISALRQL